MLSLQGNLLETYVLPHEDHYILEICCFDGKLLASYYRKGASDIVGVIALRGLQSLLRRLGFAAWAHMGGSVSVRAGCTAIRVYAIINLTLTLTPNPGACRLDGPEVSSAVGCARAPYWPLRVPSRGGGPAGRTARGHGRVPGCGRKDSPAASPRLVRVARLLNSGEHMADGVPCAIFCKL